MTPEVQQRLRRGERFALLLGGAALLVWLVILLIHRWVWGRQQGTP